MPTNYEPPQHTHNVTGLTRSHMKAWNRTLKVRTQCSQPGRGDARGGKGDGCGGIRHSPADRRIKGAHFFRRTEM